MELSARQEEFIRRCHADEVDGYTWSLGWPKESYYREQTAMFRCCNKPDCHNEWNESVMMKGIATEDDFDIQCPDCGSYNTHLDRIEDSYDDPQLSDTRDELGFSWAPCDCCGSPLGGNRFAACLIQAGSAIVRADDARICRDCLLYLANDEVPDDEYLDWLDDKSSSM